MSKEYSELFKDPRWQKKRLEILQRDNFTCQVCDDTKKTLHVHHKLYFYGRDPWDYINDFFETLCEDCHKEETDNLKDACEFLTMAFKYKFFAHDIGNFAAAVKELNIKKPTRIFIAALTFLMQDGPAQKQLLQSYLNHIRETTCQEK